MATQENSNTTAVRDHITADIYAALRTVETFDVDQQPDAAQKLDGIASKASELSTALGELCRADTYDSKALGLAALISQAERECASVLNGAEFARLTVGDASAIVRKFDEIATLAAEGSEPVEDPARAPAPLDASKRIVAIEYADGSTVDVSERNVRMMFQDNTSTDLFDEHYQLLRGIIFLARKVFLEVHEPEEGYGINQPAADVSSALDCLVDQLDKEMKGGTA